MYRRRIFQVALVVVLLDQFSKYLAVAKLEHKPAINLIGHYLKLAFTRNPGAAFSIGTSVTFLFTIFSLSIAVLIIWKANVVTHPIWAICAGGFLGGAIGNLIDRIVRSPGIFRGHVVDFIALPNFPYFNLADSAVTLSAITAALLSFRGIDYTNETSAPKDAK